MTVNSKDIKAPSAGVGDFDDEHVSLTLQEVVDVINAGTIDGPKGHAGDAGVAGATGPTGATGVGPVGPVGPVHITSFIPPTTDPHVRGAVWNPGGATGAKKLAISMG